MYNRKIFCNTYVLLCTLKTFSSAPFKNGIASPNLINVLNKRALVSLCNNEITEEKIRLNIVKNPDTTFLTCENAMSDLINHLVTKMLFTNSRKLATISNSQKLEMDIYKSMLLVITENRLVLFY